MSYAANQPNVNLVETGNIVSGTFPAGLTTVTVTARDGCGLTTIRQMNVNIGSGNHIYAVF